MACVRAFAALLVLLATTQLSPAAATALPLPVEDTLAVSCLSLGIPCNSDSECCSGDCMLVPFLPRVCIPQTTAAALAEPIVAAALAKGMYIDIEDARKRPVEGTLPVGCLTLGFPCNSDSECCSGDCMLVPFLPPVCIPQTVAAALAEPTVAAALAKDIYIDIGDAHKRPAEGTLAVGCLTLGFPCNSDTECCSGDCMHVPFLPRVCIPQTVAAALAKPTVAAALAKDMYIDIEDARKRPAEGTLVVGCLSLGIPCNSDTECCSGDCMLVPFLPRVCIPQTVSGSLVEPTVAAALANA